MASGNVNGNGCSVELRLPAGRVTSGIPTPVGRPVKLLIGGNGEGGYSYLANFYEVSRFQL